VNIRAAGSKYDTLKIDYVRSVVKLHEVYTLPATDLLRSQATRHTEHESSFKSFFIGRELPSDVVVAVGDALDREEVLVFEILDMSPQEKVLTYNFNVDTMAVPMLLQFYEIWNAPEDVQAAT
jgi:hypothetical protein